MDLISEIKGAAVGSFIFLLLLVAFVIWICRKKDFFSLPPQFGENPLTFKYVLSIFALYLLLVYLVVPLTFVIVTYWTGHYQDPAFFETGRGWFQIGALFFLFVLFIVFSWMLKPRVRHFIFWGDEPVSARRFFRSIRMGIISWLISYPFVLLVGMISNWIALKLWGKSDVEQVAVKEIKALFNHPLLLAITAVTVAILVPFMEELLFRGFLQNFIKKYLGRVWAIVITAICFAMAHFSISQGTGNFQLILTLSVLALFLGFIYEKEKTLWAPMALHMSFNSLNLLFIIFGNTA